MEGSVFFCYTNRAKTVKIIQEKVLPHLEKSINIVYLEGRAFQTSHNLEFITHALNMKTVKEFPVLMKVINSEMKYVSLRDELYLAINKKIDFDSFLDNIKLKIESL